MRKWSLPTNFNRQLVSYAGNENLYFGMVIETLMMTSSGKDTNKTFKASAYANKCNDLLRPCMQNTGTVIDGKPVFFKDFLIALVPYNNDQNVNETNLNLNAWFEKFNVMYRLNEEDKVKSFVDENFPGAVFVYAGPWWKTNLYMHMILLKIIRFGYYYNRTDTIEQNLTKFALEKNNPERRRHEQNPSSSRNCPTDDENFVKNNFTNVRFVLEKANVLQNNKTFCSTFLDHRGLLKLVTQIIQYDKDSLLWNA
jgi:hypothetical protein